MKRATEYYTAHQIMEAWALMTVGGKIHERGLASPDSDGESFAPDRLAIMQRHFDAFLRESGEEARAWSLKAVYAQYWPKECRLQPGETRMRRYMRLGCAWLMASPPENDRELAGMVGAHVSKLFSKWLKQNPLIKEMGIEAA